MRQRPLRGSDGIFWLGLLAAIAAGCERTPSSAVQRSGTIAPTVASLVPAATDLIIGIGASPHLVAVSNWDPDLPEIQGLARVGDYRTVDWEKIAQLKPDLMIVQYSEDKMPAGLRQRADAMGIRLVNVKIHRLEDVFTTIETIGTAIGETTKASGAAAALRRQLESVRARVARQPPLRTLISRSESPLAVVGGENFMDDVLQIAGGTNVMADGPNAYPTIDRETLLALNPQVVLHILPNATERQLLQARDFWTSVPQLQAVRDDRVYLLSQPYLLLPGYSVGRMAEVFAEKLHPDAEAKERQ